DLVPGGTSGEENIFLRDRTAGTTERVSVPASGVPDSDVSQNPSISGDGRLVAFESHLDTLIPGDLRELHNILVRDRATGSTERLSVAPSGGQGGDGDSVTPAISADGRFVTFASGADNLVRGDTNAVEDIFVADRASIAAPDQIA